MGFLRNRSTRFKELYCSSVMYLPVLIGGMQSAFPSLLLPQLTQEMNLNTDSISWIASLAYFSLVLGSFLSIYLIDKYGRIKNIQIIMFLYTCGWSIIGLSNSFNNFLIGIILCGTASGSSIPIATIYVTETSRSRYRGSLLSMVWMYNIIGSSIMYNLEYRFTWRHTVFVVILITLFSQLLLKTIPESKYWYLIKGMKNEAKESATWFENTAVVRKEVDIIYAFIKLGTVFNDSEGNSLCTTTIRAFKNIQLKPFSFALLLSIFRCGTGKVLFTVYPVNMFNDMQTPYNTMLLSVWYGFLNFLSCFANILVFATIDRFNRKNYFFLLSSIMIACLAIIISIDSFSQNPLYTLPWLRIVCMYIYLLVEGTGYFCVTSMIINEIIPIMQRSVALPLIFLLTNLVLAFYIKLFPYMEHELSFRNECLYFLANILVIYYLVREYVPDTMGNLYFGNMGTISSTISTDGLQDGQFDKMMKEDWFRNEDVQAFFTSNDLIKVDSWDVESMKQFNKQWLEQAKDMMKTNDAMVLNEQIMQPQSQVYAYHELEYAENGQAPPELSQHFNMASPSGMKNTNPQMFENLKKNISTPWHGVEVMNATNSIFKEQQKWFKQMFQNNQNGFHMPSIYSMPGMTGAKQDKIKKKLRSSRFPSFDGSDKIV